MCTRTRRTTERVYEYDSRVACFAQVAIAVYYAPTVGKEAISVAFVRPSVHLSVRPSVRRVLQRIIREPKGLAYPNLEGRFPTLHATRAPVSRSNGQRPGLEAGGGIPCRPNPAATLLVINMIAVAKSYIVNATHSLTVAQETLRRHTNKLADTVSPPRRLQQHAFDDRRTKEQIDRQTNRKTLPLREDHERDTTSCNGRIVDELTL